MHFSAWIIQSVCSTLNCLKECRLVGLSGHILKGYIKFVKVRSIFMHWPKNMGEKSMAKKIADTIIFMHWPKNMGEKSMAKKIADTIY